MQLRDRHYTLYTVGTSVTGVQGKDIDTLFDVPCKTKNLPSAAACKAQNNVPKIKELKQHVPEYSVWLCSNAFSHT